MVSLGVNRSKALTLPAIDVRYGNLVRKEKARFNTDIQLSAWMQPKDQLFAASKAEFGMSAGVQPRFAVTKRFSVTADLSYKTGGWVFGNPYLDQKFTGRIGFSFKTN